MLILPFIALFFCSPPDKELRYEDVVYEEQVKTVRLFPSGVQDEGKMLPAVAQLGGNALQLEFDDLQSDRANYYLKILHCNYDWTPSRLRDLDFLTQYNEFNINDYQYSSNTHIPYVHYSFQVPVQDIKLAGNYLIIVYRDGDREDLMLSKRFLVASGSATIKPYSNIGMTAIRATNQQIQFEVNYNGLDIPNPLETVNVVIRQNQRWDNAVTDIKPSFVRENVKTLEYRFFNDDKSFRAGNEFRFVDFGSLTSPGLNTQRLDNSHKPYTLFIVTDFPRGGQRYAQFMDRNGGFQIVNYNAGEGESTGNYLNVVFTLRQPLSSEKIYVAGSFNQWQKSEENEMVFKNGEYTATLLLKQGLYNYAYVTESAQNDIEGNYFETENLYEILVYNKTMYPEADQLVGYYSFRVNPR
jgi:Domain of unknown function (DUF5103)